MKQPRDYIQCSVELAFDNSVSVVESGARIRVLVNSDVVESDV